MNIWNPTSSQNLLPKNPTRDTSDRWTSNLGAVATTGSVFGTNWSYLKVAVSKDKVIMANQGSPGQGPKALQGSLCGQEEAGQMEDRA